METGYTNLLWYHLPNCLSCSWLYLELPEKPLKDATKQKNWKKNHGEFQNINEYPELAVYIAATFAIVKSISEKTSHFGNTEVYFSARALKSLFNKESGTFIQPTIPANGKIL